MRENISYDMLCYVDDILIMYNHTNITTTQTYIMPVLFTSVLFTPVLFTPVLFTPVLFTPVLFTPVLFTPVLFTPVLFTPIYNSNLHFILKPPSTFSIFSSYQVKTQLHLLNIISYNISYIISHHIISYHIISYTL